MAANYKLPILELQHVQKPHGKMLNDFLHINLFLNLSKYLCGEIYHGYFDMSYM